MEFNWNIRFLCPPQQQSIQDHCSNRIPYHNIVWNTTLDCFDSLWKERRWPSKKINLEYSHKLLGVCCGLCHNCLRPNKASSGTIWLPTPSNQRIICSYTAICVRHGWNYFSIFVDVPMFAIIQVSAHGMVYRWLLGPFLTCYINYAQYGISLHQIPFGFDGKYYFKSVELCWHESCGVQRRLVSKYLSSKTFFKNNISFHMVNT